jgi:hypothetical protein
MADTPEKTPPAEPPAAPEKGSSRLKNFLAKGKVVLHRLGFRRELFRRPGIYVLMAVGIWWGAGQIANYVPTYYDYDSANWPTRAEAAAEAGRMTEAEIRQADHKKLYALIRKLSGSTEADALIRKLVLGMPIDPDYVNAKQNARKNFETWLSGSPIIRDMREAWKDASDDERMAYLRVIMVVQGKYYEAGVPWSVYFKVPPIGDKILGGAYNPFYKGLFLNSDDEAGWDDFVAMVNVVVHEGTHAYQDQIGWKLLTMKLPKDDPSYDQARLFRWNQRHYYNGLTDYEAYAAQPMEREAFAAGDSASIAVARNRVSKDDPNWKLRMSAREMRETEASIERAHELLSGRETDPEPPGQAPPATPAKPAP